MFIEYKTHHKTGDSGRPSKRPTTATLKYLYIDKNMTAKEIAKMYNVSYKTVQSWIYRQRKAAKKKESQLTRSHKIEQQKEGDSNV